MSVPDGHSVLDVVCKTLARLVLPLFWLCAVFSGHGAAAESLLDAMGEAYQRNPSLQSERAKLRALDETVPEALAGMRPSVNLKSSDTKQNISSSMLPNSYTARTKEIDVQLEQPLYKGGQIQAKIRSAQNQVLAGRANLLSVEQTVLLDAATAYMDIIRDRARLDLTINYQAILRNRLDIEARRLRIGENTRTDVSQAESRLAEAIAQRVQGETALRASISDYVRVVGRDPERLDNPKIAVDIPDNLDDVIEAARTYNPSVIAAQYSISAARDDVEAADGQLLPEVKAVGNAQRTWNPSGPSGPRSRLDTTSIELRMTMPIDNGVVSAQARRARQTVSQKMLDTENAQRMAVDRATKSWNTLMSVKAQIQAREAVVRAVNQTLINLRTEVSIGVRALIDLLNAEQEAFSARLALVDGKHDEVVQSLTLLSAVGRLTAQNLKLQVAYYDYDAHYQRVRNKIWGVALSKDSNPYADVPASAPVSQGAPRPAEAAGQPGTPPAGETAPPPASTAAAPVPQAAVRKPPPPPPTMTEPAPVPAPAAGSLPAGGGGPLARVQLSSVTSETQADAEKSRLERRLAGLLGVLPLDIVRADLGPRGIVYRLQTVPVPLAQANSICGQLRAAHVGCLVVR